jgi:phage regulator Rha-like protein
MPELFRTINGLPVLRKLTKAERTELNKELGMVGNGPTVHYYEADGQRNFFQNCNLTAIPLRFLEPLLAPFDPKDGGRLDRCAVQAWVPSPAAPDVIDLNDMDDPETPAPEPELADEAIVTLRAGEPVTTSLAVAQGVRTDHRAVIQLVRTYKQDLEEFGPLAFEMLVVKREQLGGKQPEIALLNEPQATLLITYMKNSEIVRKFKMRLVKAFYALRVGQQHPPRAAERPTSPTEMFLAQAQLNVDYERQIQNLSRQNQTLALQQAQLDADFKRLSATVTQPMIDVYGGLVSAGDDVSMMWVCKRLGVKRLELFQHLRDRRVLMTGGSKHNYPYINFERYFAPKTVPVNAGERMAKALKVTPEGIAWLCCCYRRGEFDAFLTRERTRNQPNLTHTPGDDSDPDVVDL